jgi:hypothetical protein
MVMSEIERRWNRVMISIYETAKRELGYNAARFVQMVSERGGLSTARQLVWSDSPSDGFTFLWEHHRSHRRGAHARRGVRNPVQ